MAKIVLYPEDFFPAMWPVVTMVVRAFDTSLCS